MFWRLTLVFILFPIAELFVLWTVSGLFGWFGTWMTLVEIILSALLGAGLIKLQGARCWNEYQKKIQSGESPTSTVLHGGMILVASAFLIAPGYITDCLGLLLLVPPVRSILINYIQLRYEASRRKTDRSASRQAPEVIDIGYEKR